MSMKCQALDDYRVAGKYWTRDWWGVSYKEWKELNLTGFIDESATRYSLL